MKTATKIILSVGGAFVFLIFLAIAAFVIWVDSDEEYKKDFKAAQIEGREFGLKTDNNGCIKEGLSQAKNTPPFTDINKRAVKRAFVEECLKASRPVNDFCEGVPSALDVNEMEWRKAQCRKAAMDEIESGCLSIFDKKREYCIFDKK
ncbi:MAG: hypothetical protein H0W58_10790 [Acidobacteria bacterium]|jgi:hypothetical protein|nr:hypothetical protein [Acidobacteriota bacterium]